MTCVIDASVFVAAARTTEGGYLPSREFLSKMVGAAENVICPTLVLAECSAAIARQTGDPGLAHNLVVLIEHFPHLQFAALDVPLAQRAAQLAAAHRLRGADAVYVALAQAVNATLITWDTEMLTRGKAVVPTQTPMEWLTAQAHK